MTTSVEEPAKQTRILLADDSADNRRLTSRQLKKLGYAVETANNGLEALKALTLDAYDMVLMDCLMPEMDGYEASAELRRLEGTGSHTVVIAMTASSTADDRDRCLAAGMDDYIAKPAAIDALKTILERWQPASRHST